MVLRLWSLGWLCAGLLLGSPAFGAGVTIITHGFNSDVDDWVLSMAGAVAGHAGLKQEESVCYEIYFALNDEGEYEPRHRKLIGGDPLAAGSGEIIIKLNWSPFAGNLSGVTHSTTNVAPSVASVLLAPGFIEELDGPALAELPLHLIGHSRGGSLVYEIARLLGAEGVWVDQVTTLDPHPLNNDFNDTLLTTIVDGPAIPYWNVLYADNYYQVNNSFLGLDPSGQYVPGAYNRRLNVSTGGYSGIAPNHSNVHLWYHGTMDEITPLSDTVASITALERGAWWTEAEAEGALTGYLYSRIGGGDRLSAQAPAGGTNLVVNGLNQEWDFGAGVNPNRYELPEAAGVWPNPLTLEIELPVSFPLEDGAGAYEITAGSEIPVRLQYQYGGPEEELEIQLFLDLDANPYSGNEIMIGTAPLSSTGLENVGTVTLTPETGPELSPGLYVIGVALGDGLRTRYLYARESVRVMPAAQPIRITLASAAGGEFQALVTGEAGRTAVIEASGDLAQWVPVAINILSETGWEFRATIGPSEGMQIFRARIVD